MADMQASQTPTTDAPAVTVRHIVTSAPVPVVILPPAHVLMPVSIPEPLATDLVRRWQREDALNVQGRFKRFTFDEWVLELFRDVVYGPGVERCELERRP